MGKGLLWCLPLAIIAIFVVFLSAQIQKTAAPPLDYARFSVLTPAGPEQPVPEIFRKLKKIIHTRHKIGIADNTQNIAARYGTDVRSLQGTNFNEFIFMKRGGWIRVHNGKGVLYETASDKETLDSIARQFKRSRDGIEKLKQEIVRVNGLPPSMLLTMGKLYKGERILLPGIYRDLDTYRIPVNSYRISSYQGYRYHPILKKVLYHKGCDIPMPYGTSVYPSRSGKVIFSGWMNGYGWVVDILHSDGSKTRYGHLSKIMVNPGVTVQKGKSVIGKVGSTGLSTGPHLHFEIIDKQGRSINPKRKFGKK
ncbi:MAG: M23 family metallopeptidase [Elusimicrobia bacterium]|nr:M23 family metallopeptidase [Elusimicrobiota bacterium]